MTRGKIPLNRKTRCRAANVPIVRQIGAKQNKVTLLEGMDLIANETRSFTRGEQRELKSWVIMPMGALTGNGNAMVRRKDEFDIPQVFVPTQKPE